MNQLLALLETSSPTMLGILGVFGLLNLITFLTFGYDKAGAAAGNRRVPEKVLWTLALVGGSAGALAGMKLFRHKTRKISFQLVMGLIVLMHLGIIWVVINL